MTISVLKRILQYAKPYGRFLILALLSAVGSVALTLLTPILTGRAIDVMLGPGNVAFESLITILGQLIPVIIGSALLQWLLTVCTNHVAYYTVRDLRRAAFQKIERLPLSSLDRRARGDFVSRVIQDVETVSDGLLQGFSQLFTGVVTILGTLAFMLSIHVKITLVVVAATPLSFFVASFIAKRSYRLFQAQTETRGALTAYIEELVGGQKLVKAFGYESRAQAQFDRLNEQLRESGIPSQFYAALTNPTTRFVNNIIYAAVGVCGVFAVIGGKLRVGQLSSFLQYANQYTKPFNEISGVITELQAAVASADRVFALLDEPELPDDSALPDLTACDGRIQISQVFFSYVPERPLIQNFNLSVEPGQRIAIVGPTGCGKTTVINLLMRFYEVQQGTISVSGYPIQNITYDSLRRQFGMVLQETWLFSGTIRENLTYGRPDASEEELIAAAKATHAHSFIRRLPLGYDTVISEDGGNLSQGQKQLLCITRVMLTDPPMLILDEATSSLDTRTELLVQRAFEKLMQGKTSFVIAHRLSTIRTADRILVMRDGNVIEQGSHHELLQEGGFYAQLYESQFAPS